MPTPPNGSKRTLFVVLGALAVAAVLAFVLLKPRKAEAPVVHMPVVTDAAPVTAVAAASDAAPVTCDDHDLPACLAGADRIAATDPGQAATIYKKVCDGGVVAGCVRLGLAIERGRGLERDLARAYAIYIEACEKKDADACALAASMYEDGKGVKTDTAKAIALYTRACDAGSGLGCSGLGVLEAMGQGVPADTAKALVHFGKACAAGDPVGCLREGRAYQRGLGTDASEDKAGAVWTKLRADLPPRCEGGDARSCDVLGVISHQGLGGPADVTAAEKIFHACELGYARGCSEAAALTAMKANSVEVARKLVEDACAGGDDLGCALLGKLLVNAKETARALELFEKACGAGGETGCVDLAGLYDSGGPVNQDQARATTYYQRACEGGSFRGCLGLGSRLGNGIGAKKDEKRARVAAEKACKIEPAACWMYARHLATGAGGATDLAQAKQLYTLSCAAGEESACAYRENPVPAAIDAGVPLVSTPVDAGATP